MPSFWKNILDRMKLRNAQPISSTAQANYDQIDPNQEGAGHTAFTHNITGAGTNQLQIKRALAKIEAQLKMTVDPGLTISLENAANMLRSQLTRSSLGTANGLGPDRTVPNNTGQYRFSGPYDEGSVSGQEQTKISTFAGFQLFGTLRQKVTKVPQHRYIEEAGSVPGVTDNEKRAYLAFRNPGNPDGQVFHYGDPPDVATHLPSHGVRRGTPYAPGRTHHKQSSTGPVGRGHAPSHQASRGYSGQVKSNQAGGTG